MSAVQRLSWPLFFITKSGPLPKLGPMLFPLHIARLGSIKVNLSLWVNEKRKDSFDWSVFHSSLIDEIFQLSGVNPPIFFPNCVKHTVKVLVTPLHF